MSRDRRRAALPACLVAAALLLVAFAAAAGPGGHTPEARATIISHGPWPPAPARDASNRASGNREAIALGARLFADPRLSGDRAFSCASCHRRERGFGDGRPTGLGRAPLTRNTPALYNLRGARWFGWDGAADNLWAQSLRPILAPREMAMDAVEIAAVVAAEPAYACAIERVFGERPGSMAPRTALVAVGKALAAYQETLVTPRTAFDEYRDALAAGDAPAAARYPASARRGLDLFVGRGKCSLCHYGPAFSNGEFANVGIGHYRARGEVDTGRYGGIQSMTGSAFNLLGAYNDDASGASANHTRHVELNGRNWGQFKVPGLRNVALTAPYMHDGSLATLADVVRHYSEIDASRFQHYGQGLLAPLRLAEAESADLVAFLHTLTARLAEPDPDPVPGACR